MKIHRKVRHTEENQDEDSYNSVCNNESLLYTGFVIRREFVRGSAKSKGPDIFLLYRKISYSRVSYYQDSTVDYSMIISKSYF